MSRIFVHMLRLLMMMAVLVGLNEPVVAADIFEPWERGFSDVELYLGLGEGGHAQGQVLAGFGFDGGGSVGLSLSTQENDEPRLGLFLAGTWSVGRRADLSVWAESGLAAGSLDVELAHADWTAGLQLVRWRDGMTPYGSVTLVGEEGENLRLHPMLGVMVPNGNLEVHVELSSDQPRDGGAWPLHLAVGPNVHVTPWCEVLPELSVVRDGAGCTHWALTVGVILDPRHWSE